MNNEKLISFKFNTDNLFFTADPHFSHHSIITYCNRPWKNINEMNKDLINNWNSVVGENDYVIVVGDLTMKLKREGLENIFKKLNGIKDLVVGNHDILKISEYEYMGFRSVHNMLPIFYNNEQYICIHDPAAAQVRSQKFIVGHIHNLWKKIKNTVNVGVDVWDYKPISFRKVLECFDDEREYI